MSVLLAYATKCASTQRIAEHIATTLRVRGLVVEMQPITVGLARSRYDAVLIGIATPMASGLGDVKEFVRRNRTALNAKPVWLFSCGRLLTGEEWAAFAEVFNLRSQRVFNEAGPRMGADQDFRDWMQIEGWADSIARELRMVPAVRR